MAEMERVYDRIDDTRVPLAFAERVEKAQLLQQLLLSPLSLLASSF